MAKKTITSSTQLLNFSKDSYLERTSRPVYALVFLLPFIVFYELGTILINTDVLNETQTRVLAFVWLQRFLEYIGFGGKFAWAAPPVAVVIILTGLQLASKKRWLFRAKDLVPMTIECMLLAVPLIVFSLLFNTSMTGDSYNPNSSVMGTEQRGVVYCSASESTASFESEQPVDISQGKLLLANIVTGIGAGIYEELVFRLLLICGLMILFQDLAGLSHRQSIILSVAISSALFSAHHHIDLLTGEPSSVFSAAAFIFRTFAGVYFAVLFAIRGFGVTSGTHAFYNIIATCINTLFFQ
ncbi:MAG: CPBP family intramembrane glutamic endopeptidase [Planctomycetota bacterium]|jgi:membrane protease YdiL (CAAX protease family)